jgi:hypothetical protein
MKQIWYGKTKYFDEIVDSLECAGIKCEVDRKAWTIKVPDKDYTRANGILKHIRYWYSTKEK